MTMPIVPRRPPMYISHMLYTPARGCGCACGAGERIVFVRGPAGPPGPPGLPGTQWFTGPTDPPDPFPGANDRDLYFNTETGDIWRFTAGAFRRLTAAT